MHSCVGCSISPFLLTISWLSLVLTPVLLVTIYKVLEPPCFFLQSPTHVNCLVPALLLGISCDIHCWCWLGSTSCFGSCMFLFSFPFLAGEAPDFPPHLPQSYGNILTELYIPINSRVKSNQFLVSYYDFPITNPLIIKVGHIIISHQISNYVFLFSSCFIMFYLNSCGLDHAIPPCFIDPLESTFHHIGPGQVEAFCNQLTLNPALCAMTRPS